VSNLLDPVSHEIDTQAALKAERYAHALKVLSPSDVLATLNDSVSHLVNAHDHPLQALVEYCLQYGTTKRSDKRP
jgi:hypothetical protein